MVSKFQEANQLLRTGNLKEAVAAYRQAIEENSGFYWAYQNFGETLWKLGRLDEAVEVFRQAVVVNPGAGWSHFCLGQVFAKQKRWNEAIASYQQALGLQLHQPEVFYELGIALAGLKRWDEAVEAYQRAIERDETQHKYYHHLGDARLRQGEFEEAIACYQKALELNPISDWSHYNLGQALEKLGRREEAIACYQRAIALGFAGAEVRHYLGYAFSQLGRFEEAVVELRKAVELNPRSAVVWQQLGDVLRQLGENEEAVGVYQKALELKPGWIEVQHKLMGLSATNTVVKPQNAAFSNLNDETLDVSQGNILVVSRRASRIFSPETQKELNRYFINRNYNVSFSDEYNIRVENLDAVIILSHQLKEVEIIDRLKSKGFNGKVISWFWDNHHHTLEDEPLAAKSDVCIPAHSCAVDHLMGGKVLEEAFPMCVTQWTVNQAQEFFERYGLSDRSDSLYGGFTRYSHAEKRNQLLEEIIRELPDAKVSLFDKLQEGIYFNLTSEQRFAQWCGYKTSICLPLDRDLSQRFFDALLCGQIPIVSPDVADLDLFIPPSIQRDLPVLKLKHYNLESVREAHQQAIAQFDAEGLNGVKRRHQFALNNHLLVHRVEGILLGLENQSYCNLNNNSTLSYYYEGGNRAAIGDWHKAIEIYSQAIEIGDNPSRWYTKLADLMWHWAKSNLDIAFKNYDLARQFNPDVLENYHKALRIEPDNSELYLFLADALSRQQRWEAAKVFYQMAIELDKNNAQAYVGLSNICVQKNQKEKATELLARANRIDSDLVQSYLSKLFVQV